MTYAINSFEFGYTAALTSAHRAYWGARTIWRGHQDKTWDLLPDRQGWLAENEAAQEELHTLLNGIDGVLRKARLAFDALVKAEDPDLRASKRHEFLLYADDRVEVLANTQASHGYVYLCARLLTPSNVQE